MLVCAVGPSLCALPLSNVIETMRPLPIDPIAPAIRGVLGLALIRGAPTLVVDAAAMLGHPPEAPGRFVTMRTSDRVVALAVQGVRGVETISEGALRELPPMLRDAEVIERIGSRDRELLLVLRAARLLPERTA